MKSVRSIAIALSTLMCFCLGTGCTGFSRSSAPVMLASGTTEGVAWHVWAWEQDGTLCMATGTAAGPDGGSITPSARAISGGSCEFDRKYPDSAYYSGAQGGGSGGGQFTASLAFGPLPNQATQIRVASRLILKSEPFPSGKGLPAGRFWVWAGPFEPPASEGTVLDTPQPLDSSGKPVAFQAF